jgi:hypothetical protein
MDIIAIDKKAAWLKTFQSNEYIKTLELNLEKLAILSDIEFLSLSWRVYHDELLAYGKNSLKPRSYLMKAWSGILN